MDLNATNLELGSVREPTTWVAFEATTVQHYHFKPKRRKGARGRATEAEMAAMLASGAKLSRREQNLRPEQIEALRLKREPKDHSVVCLDQEDGEGNVEYKFRIKDPHPVRLQQLITQMKFRLSEGNGECFYYIGVEDNGYPKGLQPADLEGSIATLHRMASSLDAYVTLLHYLPAAWGRRAALLRVATRTAQEACHTDLRIAVAGSVDAGKSTLVAVLAHGSDGRPLLDNGRGLARMAVFRHKHEMQSGRTSSICHQLLGYDREGRVINYATPAATALTPAEITSSAAKVLTFLDLAGHERYLKTALYGMTALLPDYVLLCVCAVAGLGRIAREHLAVAVALEVPVAVVVTKVELVRPERLEAVVSEVRQLVALTLQHESGPGAAGAGPVDERRVEDASPLVTSEADAVANAAILGQLHADSLASPTARGALRVHMPIFPISAVTGVGLSVLHAFLNALQPGAAAAKGGSTGAAAAALLGSGGSGSVEAALMRTGSGSGSDVGGCAAGTGADSSAGYGSSSGCGGSPRAAQADSVSPVPCQTLQSVKPTPTMTPMQQHLYAPIAAAAAAAAAVPLASAEAQPVHFQVDGTFEVEGVGSVLSGTLLSGILRLGQELMLGPTPAGDFTRVVVRQLQRSHVQVKQVRAGQTCTIAISPAGAHAAGVIVGVAAAVGSTGGGVMGNGATTRGGTGVGGVQYDNGALPLGSSPGAAPPPAGAAGDGGLAGYVTAGAAVGATTTSGGDGDGFDDALAAAEAALELCLAGGSDDDDACGGGGGDDLFSFDVSDGPGFSPPPVSSRRVTSTTLSSSASPPASYLAGGGGGFGGRGPGAASNCAPPEDPSCFSGMPAGSGGGNGLPFSMPTSNSALHSTTSFCVGAGIGVAGRAVGGGGGAALSTSAPPARTLSAGAVAAAAAATAGSPPAFSPAMTPTRKGSVLLEPALQPKATWTFEAVLVLLGGHWPPRGLVSGRWPPACDEDLPEALRPESVSLSEPVSGRLASNSSGNLTSDPSGYVTPAGTAVTVPAAGGSSSGSAAEEDGEGGVRKASGVEEPPTALCTRVAESGGEGGAGAGRKASVVSSNNGRVSGRRRRQRGAGAGTYVTVVHCGSVRQPAQVLMMEELLEGSCDGGSDGDLNGGMAQQVLRISASTRAAAALMHSAQQASRNTAPAAAQPPCGQAGKSSLAANGCDAGTNEEVVVGEEQAVKAATMVAAPAGVQEHEDLGCLVRVLLRWQHRPEWLREGAKLLVRDRSDGRVAGAGFVRRVLL